MRTDYVTYEEAQTLIPIFRYLEKEAPYVDLRKSAGKVLMALKRVRSVDYAPLRGYQIILDEREHDLLKKVMDEFL